MQNFRKLWGDERGAVVHIFAITFMLLLTIVGFGIDISSSVSEKEKLRSAADMAAVNTARALLAGEITEHDAKKYAQTAFNQYAAGYGAGGESVFGKVTFQSKTEVEKITKDGQTTYKVRVHGTAKVPASPLSIMLREGKSGTNVMDVGFNSESTARTEQAGSFSMALILDKSGSMGWNNPTRMTELKKAVTSLVGELNDVDPNNKFARLGAYSYDSYYRGRHELTWNRSAVNYWVNRLYAGGGTAAYSAIAKARIDLLDSSETSAHKAKNGQTPQLFMLYMTDGADSRSSQARDQCNIAKRAGITVYTVAFQAPSSGKKLLKDCATSNKHYYDAKNSDELNQVFRKIAKETANSVPFISG